MKTSPALSPSLEGSARLVITDTAVYLAVVLSYLVAVLWGI